MRRFIKAFVIFWKGFAPQVPQDWDKDDALLLQQFRATRAGRRLIKNMQAQSFEQDRQATLEIKETRWQAGVATGYRLAMMQIEQFSVVPTVEEDEYEAIPEKTGGGRFDQNSR